MPAVVRLHGAFMVPASVALGFFLVGMAVLDAEVAVQED